jgi:TRAP-type C4-dicarboxylate transport system permease small subunit
VKAAGATPRALLILDRGLIALNVAGAALIFVLLVLINTDAIGRTWFALPIIGVHEIVELSVVAIVFLQLGDTVRIGRLTRSDGMLLWLHARAPAAERALRILFDLLAAAFMALLVWGGVPRLIDSYQRDEFAGTAMLFTFPEWPVKLIIVVGASAAGARLLASAWQKLR